MHIKKGDIVYMRIGKDRGKTGKVLRVLPQKYQAIVEGMNEYRKRARPKSQGEKGETVTVSLPVQAAKLGVYCSRCKRAVRTGVRREGSSRVRYCRKCQIEV